MLSVGDLRHGMHASLISQRPHVDPGTVLIQGAKLLMAQPLLSRVGEYYRSSVFKNRAFSLLSYRSMSLYKVYLLVVFNTHNIGDIQQYTQYW